jgi:hypothetical protein
MRADRRLQPRGWAVPNDGEFRPMQGTNDKAIDQFAARFASTSSPLRSRWAFSDPHRPDAQLGISPHCGWHPPILLVAQWPARSLSKDEPPRTPTFLRQRISKRSLRAGLTNCVPSGRTCGKGRQTQARWPILLFQLRQTPPQRTRRRCVGCRACLGQTTTTRQQGRGIALTK